jgi:hypothetical protein
MGNRYVHGYSAEESARLTDQANTLTWLLHGDTRYPAGARVLEMGCGMGAQTVIQAYEIGPLVELRQRIALGDESRVDHVELKHGPHGHQFGRAL